MTETKKTYLHHNTLLTHRNKNMNKLAYTISNSPKILNT